MKKRMQSVCARAEAVRRCEVSIASSPGGDRGRGRREGLLRGQRVGWGKGGHGHADRCRRGVGGEAGGSCV